MGNDSVLDLAFCFPLNSRLEKCMGELGDDTLTYEENGMFVFERNSTWYAVPERDSFGNWIHTMDWDTFKLLQFVHGDNFIPVRELPQEEV